MLTAFGFGSVVDGNANPFGCHGDVGVTGLHDDREVLRVGVALAGGVVEEGHLETQSPRGLVEGTKCLIDTHIIHPRH